MTSAASAQSSSQLDVTGPSQSPVTDRVCNARPLPHPVPYQGSKRKLAAKILAYANIGEIGTFFEPFAGSAAVTLAAASTQAAKHFHLSDSFGPLAELWNLVINDPLDLSNRYASIWIENDSKTPSHYNQIRAAFNQDADPAKLLYLLARCVKSAVRFNAAGQFNQSADKRRLGTKPDTMRRSIVAASQLLAGKTTATSNDYARVLKAASPDDFIYLDPPWQGTSLGKDRRYHQLLDRDTLYANLAQLNERSVPFLLSFDGRCGDAVYGEPIPSALSLTLVDLPAGRSSQATLAGRDAHTVESLYLSPALVDRVQL